jgi:GMP synthase-like glutamine amidotransferase
MRVVVVKHHAIDEAGFISAAFAARGAELSEHLFPADGPLPALDGIDHIIVLGAVWSVYDHEQIGAWIDTELDWLRAADAAGVPILGICFGAQALATAFGGRAEPAPHKEIGWFTVESAEPGLVHPGPWLEFHGDQCIVPPDGRVLARNEVCVQAFTVGRHLGVQFHPEVDGAQVSRWMDDGGREEAERHGVDAQAVIARSFAEEAAAAERAGQLVAAALLLAAESPLPAGTGAAAVLS